MYFGFYCTASILLLNTQKPVSAYNGFADDDLKTPEDKAVDAPNFSWSWRVSLHEYI